VFAAGVVRQANWLLALWLAGVLLPTTLLWWDAQANAVVFLTLTQKDYLPGLSEKVVIPYLLGELFSWGWAVVGLFYVLPGVLVPLARSYSVSQVLWLRLTPCTARDLALARLVRVLAASGVLAGLALAWAAICCAYHGLALSPFLVPVLGVLAHLWLASGGVLLAAPRLRTETGRSVCAFVALLIPLLSCAIMRAGEHHLTRDWLAWWPYAGPFTTTLQAAGQHFAVCAALGGVLLLLSLLTPHRIATATPFGEDPS
jgi:hypothetical protein